MIRKRRLQREDRRKIARAFASHRHFYYYAKGKLAWDPVYPVVLDRLMASQFPLLDVGCGIGLLSVSLREAGATMPIRAFDVDARKMDWAKQHLKLKDVDFFTGDACFLPEHEGDMVILDILHYFEPKVRTRILEDIIVRVAPGGRVLIRCGIRSRSWRYGVTLLEEFAIGVFRWIPVQGWNFPTFDQVTQPFVKAGFSVFVSPMWGRTPFNSYFFECVRPADS